MLNNIVKGVETVSVDNNPEYVITLNEEEKEQLSDLYRLMPPLDVDHINDEILNQIELLKNRVPERLAQALISYKRSSNKYGTLLIRNLPTENNLPETPRDGRASLQKLSRVSEYNLLTIMLYTGEPIAYEDEKEGAVIQNIIPVKGHEDLQENTGSNFLEFHTEDGFHPFKPDYIGLYCLKSDHEKKAKTFTSSIRMITKSIPTNAIILLRQPLYKIKSSSSFVHADQSEQQCVMKPILTGSLFEPDMCVDFYLMEGIDHVSSWALNYLKKVLLLNTIGFVLLPGDLILIDNNTAVHARTPFSPKYDGNDRWLQRMFTVSDFRKTSHSRVKGSNVCSPLDVELAIRSLQK